MFQQIPPEMVAAVIESAGEMYLNRLAERKMAAVAELNYELQLLLGAALCKSFLSSLSRTSSTHNPVSLFYLLCITNFFLV